MQCSLIFWAKQLQDSATITFQLIIGLAVDDARNPLTSFTHLPCTVLPTHHSQVICTKAIVTNCFSNCMGPYFVFRNGCGQFPGQSSYRMWIMHADVSLELPQLTTSSELVWHLKVLIKLIITLTSLHRHIYPYIYEWGSADIVVNLCLVELIATCLPLHMLMTSEQNTYSAHGRSFNWDCWYNFNEYWIKFSIFYIFLQVHQNWHMMCALHRRRFVDNCTRRIQRFNNNGASSIWVCYFFIVYQNDVARITSCVNHYYNGI